MKPKIWDISQLTPEGTTNPEWLALRSRFPTASECGNLITPAKLEPSKSIDGYVALKLAERWLGAPLQSFSGSSAMAQGKLREVDARNWYGMKLRADVDTPGFVTNVDPDTAPKGYPVLGCSPDAHIPSLKRGAEIKSPEPDTHVAWWLAGVLPKDYRLQVQATMMVFGYDEWDFLSHCPGDPDFPKLLIAVKKERDVWDALGEALEMYWVKFNAGWARLLDANGGEEPVHRFTTEYGENGEVIRTLKPAWADSADPIGMILEGR